MRKLEKVIDSPASTSDSSGSSLQKYSHIGIGGKAKYFFVPQTLSELAEILVRAAEGNREIIPIGGCSNILFGNVRDRVIISDQYLPVTCESSNDLVVVSCNIKVGAFIEEMRRQNLGGLEFLAGIPAHLGGALHMNAGAFDKSISDYLSYLEIIDRQGKLQRIPASHIKCGYRSNSVQDFIVRAAFKLEKKSSAKIMAEINRILSLRKERHPYDHPSLGSVFKNPEGHFAGILIRDCGLAGKRIGDAQISTKHSNFILNLGNATFRDYKALIDLAQAEVLKNMGVKLELEIKVLD